MKYTNSLIIILILLILSFFFYKSHDSSPDKVPQTIKIGDKIFLAEVVRTPEDRAQGLSGRESLAEDSGMLFVFTEPTLAGFWMKDMLFAIDIIWIDESMMIVGVMEDLKPESFPQIFYPPNPIKYALELPSGAVSKNSIDTGIRVFFESEF